MVERTYLGIKSGFKEERMSTTKAITDPSEMEFLTEAPALEERPAPAVAKPGIAALLMKWIGYECQVREETTTLPTTNDDVEEQWEKWVHGCGRGVR
jgi:hypothetical protein